MEWKLQTTAVPHRNNYQNILYPKYQESFEPCEMQQRLLKKKKKKREDENVGDWANGRRKGTTRWARQEGVVEWARVEEEGRGLGGTVGGRHGDEKGAHVLMNAIKSSVN